eukprot:94206-Prymnesium_polylepis.1
MCACSTATFCAPVLLALSERRSYQQTTCRCRSLRCSLHGSSKSTIRRRPRSTSRSLTTASVSEKKPRASVRTGVVV